MFARMPIFERLISPTKPSAPFERTARDYERYDHNSLLAEEEEARGLVPEFMDRSFDVPSRAEMHMALGAFADRAAVRVRYGCRWESTRREDDGRLVLGTSDGEYRCRAAVFAIGVTEPWKPKVPGFDMAPHYAETRSAARVRGPPRRHHRQAQLGLRDREWAAALGARGRDASPRPVNTTSIALLADPHPLPAAVRRVRARAGRRLRARRGDRAHRPAGRRPSASWRRAQRSQARSRSRPTTCIIATGFRTPLLDLPELGVATVSDGRIPALTPFFESISRAGHLLRRERVRRARPAC